MMKPALAHLIILTIYSFRKHFKSVLIAGAFISYFLWLSGKLATLSSYPFQLAFPFLAFGVTVCSGNYGDSTKHEKPWMKDHVERLGGTGPKIAAYLRVSSGKQVKGFSLEAQYHEICRMKARFKPSIIYWFVDPGKSGSRDFDKRKMNDILRLRERDEIHEFWVWNIERMGRECRRLLYYFLDFCDEGAKIVTPKNEYSLKDLPSLITYIFDAHSAQKSNDERTAAVKAGKAASFQRKHWNKPTPLGYVKRGEWLERDTSFDPLIKELHSYFSSTKSIALTRKHINRKFSLLFQRPPHLGEVVIDPVLAFIDEKTFQNNLGILSSLLDRYKPKRIGPLEQLASSRPLAFLKILELFELHHRGCGGLVRKNGTTNDEGEWQQLLHCKKCSAEWRLPPISRRSDSRFAKASDENFLGNLVIDNRQKARKTKIAKNTRKSKAIVHINCTQNLLEFI
jgi:DNA invertase Pin-like site-specific DNA recombinase